MDKLLPCPFCGSAAKICEDEEGYFCVACMGECFSCTEPHGEPEHAADTWNQRTPDPALLALARLGAWALDHDDIYDSDRRAAGALMMDGCAPGDVSALAARLLAPDGAGEVADA